MARRQRSKGSGIGPRGFIRTVHLRRDDVPSFDEYPFALPAVRDLVDLDLDPRITFLVGENGSGKSTLLEAVAVAAGFNAEGGSKNFNFATCESHSELNEYLRLVRNPTRERNGFFLRAESYFNVATRVDAIDAPGPNGQRLIDAYGGRSLHQQSHGESVMALVKHRFGPNGLYLMDEPEAALSPSRQLMLLRLMKNLIDKNSQFVVATHSAMLLAYPGALIYQLGENGPQPIAYEDTEHYQLWKQFLDSPARYFKHLFADD